MNQCSPHAAPVVMKVTLLSALLLACSSVSHCGWIYTPASGDRGAVMEQRGRTLLARLQRGELVRMVAFGDSLTAGFGTDGHHVYCRIVADFLQFAFPQARIELIVHGHPGETTADALGRFDGEVKAGRPDLLLVQFGGNDKGWGRALGDFRTDLGRLLRRSRDETEALVIACLPPIVDSNPANSWSEAARGVAGLEGIPAADLDRAIRRGDGDFRGPFPCGSHPDGFTHAIMAREVMRALYEALGLSPAFTCELRRGSRLSGQSVYDLEARLTSASDVPIECEVRLEWEGKARRETVRLEPRETSRLHWKLPMAAFAGRSRAYPVRLLVRGGEMGDGDLAWLTVAPAVAVEQPGIAADGTGDPTWHHLGEETLVVGRHHWLGENDLSARFSIATVADSLRFTLEVTDDDITTGPREDPAQGDCIELYLDLRADADQGKPVYSPHVIALQIAAPNEGSGAGWRSMEPLGQELDNLAVTCRRTEGGYRAQVDLPLSAVTALRGADWPGLGFDIGVNDADGGGSRKAQMMWTGFPDNYLNPGYLGGLWRGVLPPDATRQTLR